MLILRCMLTLSSSNDNNSVLTCYSIGLNLLNIVYSNTNNDYNNRFINSLLPARVRMWMDLRYQGMIITFLAGEVRNDSLHTSSVQVQSGCYDWKSIRYLARTINISWIDWILILDCGVDKALLALQQMFSRTSLRTVQLIVLVHYVERYHTK